MDISETGFSSSDFGKDFYWGVASSAFQFEGSAFSDGKAESIWDRFSSLNGKIRDGSNANISADFYRRFPDDILLAKSMNFNTMRISVSWPRILPHGTGKINPAGIAHYRKLTDACLSAGIEPWITLYHWDLPQVLEEKGGWTNRDIVSYFGEYADVCSRYLGDTVKKWIILNEPMSFTGLGYFLGYHAPGKKGIGNFLAAAHHAALSQAEGGRIVKSNIPDSYTGTSQFCTFVQPVNQKERNVRAAARMDALLNRFFMDPLLGLGYPVGEIPGLKKVEKYFLSGDEDKLKFSFDFIGLQYYYRLVSRYNPFTPFIYAQQIPASKRKVRMNSMGLEVYPEGIYHLLKEFSRYKGISDIIISESGTCGDDYLLNGKVADKYRIDYYRDTLRSVLKAKREGVNVKGFFAWSLTDNFEWREGLDKRFGLVYIDYKDQSRYIKNSGIWFKKFLIE
jgi:beta-glucosidase